MRALAATIHDNVTATLGLDGRQMMHAQVHCVAEEAGEFVGAFRRWIGMARRDGPFGDVEAELADVVISAYAAAHALGIDLDAAICAKADTVLTRGWKQGGDPSGQPAAGKDG